MEEYYSNLGEREFSEFTAPPSSPPRTMAEWEEIQALVITWTSYPATLAEIVKYAKEETEVIIICSSPTSVTNYLANQGIDTENVTFIVEDFDSVWMRDYGANSVYAGDVDSLMLVEWIYNRPRPDDDVIPTAVAQELDLPLYSTTAAPTDLVHTGGNFTADGLGTGFSSELILEENEPGNPYGVTTKSEAQIDQIMYDFMGIERYIKMPTLPYDGIHHIDMHMRLIDEETILVGEYPEGVADGPQIEANIQYIQANFMSAFGTPYKIVRIQMPPDGGNYPDVWWADYRTYTNSVFVNKTVLVPVYEPQYDEPALEIYREALPGYNVVGIDCNNIIQASGALHCITRAVGVNDPLWIVHDPLEDVIENTGDYTVNADIKHRDGIANATLFYTTDLGVGYQSMPMALTNAATDTWSADIPNQLEGSTIFYYINGVANNGKTINRPMPAPEGYWDFKILDNATSISNPGNAPDIELMEIFPNPAGAITCIPIQSSQWIKNAELSLIDVHGRRVKSIHSGEIKQGDNKFFIFANEFPAGAYFVRLQHNAGSTTRRLIIK